jgi:hypothetical protein
MTTCMANRCNEWRGVLWVDNDEGAYALCKRHRDRVLKEHPELHTKVRPKSKDEGKQHQRLYGLLNMKRQPKELNDALHKATEKKCKLLADWIERTNRSAIKKALLSTNYQKR